MSGTSHTSPLCVPRSVSGCFHLTGGETRALGLETTHAQPHASQEADLGLLRVGQV